MIIQFGRFELKLKSGDLSHNGILLKLKPQPSRLLVELVSRAGELVSREEIRAKLWECDTFTDFETGINSCVRQIRRILGDDPQHPQYIQTEARRGYRFIAPVQILEDGQSHQRQVCVCDGSGASSGIVLYVEPVREIGGASCASFAESLREELIMELAATMKSKLLVADGLPSGAHCIAAIAGEQKVTHFLRISVRRNEASIRVAARINRCEDQMIVDTRIIDRTTSSSLDPERETAKDLVRFVRECHKALIAEPITLKPIPSRKPSMSIRQEPVSDEIATIV